VLEQGCSVHIVLESLVVSGAQDVDKIEELIQLNQIAARLPKDLPKDLSKAMPLN
jgi:hypothetical protein